MDSTVNAELDALVDQAKQQSAELAEASRETGFSMGVNAAFEVIQRHVDLPTAHRIGEALLNMLKTRDEA